MRRLVRLAIALLGTSLFVACSLEDLDGYATGEPPVTPVPEAGLVDASDVGVADAPVSSSCTRLGRFPATRFIDINDGEGSSVACGQENVLADDGKIVGLDRNADGNCDEIADHRVTGCIGVEMPARISTAVVRMLAVADGCAGPCVGASCGTGRTANVFAGPDIAKMTFLREQEITGESAEYSFPVAERLDARFVIVCRTCFGLARDDVGVDAILGECR